MRHVSAVAMEDDDGLPVFLLGRWWHVDAVKPRMLPELNVLRPRPERRERMGHVMGRKIEERPDKPVHHGSNRAERAGKPQKYRPRLARTSLIVADASVSARQMRASVRHGRARNPRSRVTRCRGGGRTTRGPGWRRPISISIAPVCERRQNELAGVRGSRRSC